jgi:hypothetical protein
MYREAQFYISPNVEAATLRETNLSRGECIRLFNEWCDYTEGMRCTDRQRFWGACKAGCMLLLVADREFAERITVNLSKLEDN